MKLFAYYALHSLKNQIRKLLKTWVLIFLLVCMAIGGVIGFGAARLEELAEETSVEELFEEPEEDGPGLWETLGLEPNAAAELAAGGIILAVLLYQILSADTNGSKIFLPADVNLLFASPMRPQSVLMFRLMTKLGTFIALGVYFLLQLPNLVLNLGMSIWAALALIATWCLTVMVGSLLQVLLYIFSSAHPGVKSHLRHGVYALIAVLAGCFLLFRRRSGGELLPAVTAFFNAPLTRYIPFWGWLKGFFLFALENNPLGSLACFAALAAGMGLLLWIIRRLEADFYEDAMAKSEETAQLLEAARSEKSTGIVRRRKKDRSDTLRRDGLWGRGASVFFAKSLYNRFRFAHLGFFTKTMETYLASGVGMALLCRYVLDTRSVIPVALTLSGLAFFRALGNPLEQDTKMDFFLLIPESTWAKLLWSLLGGAANCLLDAMPAILAAALILRANLLTALAWLLFAVSVDVYATCVGTFINLSVPVSAGTTVKQVVQIMFIYFGLLPDIAVMAVGLILDYPVIAAVIAAGLNVILGLLFFALSPLFLEPGSKAVPTAAPSSEADTKSARRVFSRLELGTTVILLLATGLQLLIVTLSPVRWRCQEWFIWAATFAPLYLVGMPVGWLILRKVPARRGEPQSLDPDRLLGIVAISFFLMYAGNLIGTAVNAALQSLPDVSAVNPVEGYAMGTALIPKVLFMVVLAPCLEELLFRRVLIDRMRVYGQRLAVVLSALMFGLFHGNFSQFFYAFALGLVFGYVYLRTNRLRYSVGLHMFINFFGSVVSSAVVENVDFTLLTGDFETLLRHPGNLAFLIYIALIILLALTGLVLLIVRSRRVYFEPEALELPKGTRFAAAALNPGMLFMLLGCGGLFVANLLG